MAKREAADAARRSVMVDPVSSGEQYADACALQSVSRRGKMELAKSRAALSTLEEVLRVDIEAQCVAKRATASETQTRPEFLCNKLKVASDRIEELERKTNSVKNLSARARDERKRCKGVQRKGGRGRPITSIKDGTPLKRVRLRVRERAQSPA